MVLSWLFVTSLIMDGDGMTQEEYVDRLKQVISKDDPNFVDEVKDWSLSDQMYVFLHWIQLQEMEDIKELLKMVLRK